LAAAARGRHTLGLPRHTSQTDWGRPAGRQFPELRDQPGHGGEQPGLEGESAPRLSGTRGDDRGWSAV